MVDYTNRREAQARLNALKQLLNNTDYKAIKAAEGSPGSDWEEIKVKRQEWRDEVNELEPVMAYIPGEEM